MAKNAGQITSVISMAKSFTGVMWIVRIIGGIAVLRVKVST